MRVTALIRHGCCMQRYKLPLEDLPKDIDDALMDIFPGPAVDLVDHQVDACAYEWPHPVANLATGLSIPSISILHCPSFQE
jgi:hypothetical protein